MIYHLKFTTSSNLDEKYVRSLVKRLLLSGEGTKSSSGHKVGGAFKEIKVGGRMRHIAFKQ